MDVRQREAHPARQVGRYTRDPMYWKSYALALSVPAIVCVASAAQAAGPATAFVKGKCETVTKLLAEKPSPEREKKLDAEFAGFLDYDGMAKAVLGEEAQSPTEVARFTGVLKQLLQLSFKNRLTDLASYQITYDAEVTEGTDVVVQTTAKNGKDKKAFEFAIDYTVRKKGADWVVVDVAVDKASWVQGRKKDLARGFQKDGWGKTIKKLEDKLASEKAAAAKP